MKFTMVADRLRAAAEACALVAPETGQKPQLEATLITAFDGGIVEFTATDLADAIWFRIDGAQDVEPGRMCLPSINLLRVIKQADDRPITFALKDGSGRASVEFGDTKAKLPVEPPEDFPVIQRFDPAVPFVTMPAPALSAMFKRVNFSVMNDFKARVLAGVNIDIRPMTLRMTATDGVRMATVERDIKNVSDKRVHAVVPPIAPKYLKTFVNDEGTDTVDIQLTEGSFRLRGTRGELTRRALVGNYPDFDLEKMYGSTYQTHVEVANESLCEVLETASLIKASHGTTCEFKWEESGLEIEAVSGLDGHVQAKLPVRWTYPPFKIRLDAGLFAEAVKVADAERLQLSFGDNRTPALMRETADGFLYLYAIAPKF